MTLALALTQAQKNPVYFLQVLSCITAVIAAVKPSSFAKFQFHDLSQKLAGVSVLLFSIEHMQKGVKKLHRKWEADCTRHNPFFLLPDRYELPFLVFHTTCLLGHLGEVGIRNGRNLTRLTLYGNLIGFLLSAYKANDCYKEVASKSEAERTEARWKTCQAVVDIALHIFCLSLIFCKQSGQTGVSRHLIELFDHCILGFQVLQLIPSGLP